MVFRQRGKTKQMLLLADGGPVIGLLDIALFKEASIALEQGDLFVAYTDGISEAMNVDDEEWGEERLADAIVRCDALPAGQVIDRLMREADAFVAGAPQHDDMTLIA